VLYEFDKKIIRDLVARPLDPLGVISVDIQYKKESSRDSVPVKPSRKTKGKMLSNELVQATSFY